MIMYMGILYFEIPALSWKFTLSALGFCVFFLPIINTSIILFTRLTSQKPTLVKAILLCIINWICVCIYLYYGLKLEGKL